MSASAATYSYEMSSTPSRFDHRGSISLDEVAGIARRRATKLDTAMPVDVLVHRIVTRFDDTFGRTACPVDLDGWIRRTMREIVVAGHQSRYRARAEMDERSDLVDLLKGLAVPVRSPGLAKQRKALLRRISELIGGAEGRVVLAMIADASVDRVADRLNISAIDVARLHRVGLQRLQTRLDHDHELAAQLRDAARQPKRARTSR